MPRASIGGPSDDTRVSFFCPGCDDVHQVRIGSSHGWTWNENVVHPTFSPSVLVQGAGLVCHSFVTEGRIQYLADSTHAMAGQTVDLPEWEA